MAKRQFRVFSIGRTVWIICFFISFFLSPYSLQASAQKHNVLLITIDTLRPDRLSCYGSPYVKTPNIDKLASSGVLFTRAFAHTPLTLPSHANILLGTTPLQHGVHDNGLFRVPEGLPNLAIYLKKAGYRTGAFVGSFPLDARFGLNPGFEIYDQNYGSGTGLDFMFTERKAEAVVSSALNWLKDEIKDKDQPWFLWIHCFDPHQPYEPPEPYASQFKNDLYSGEVAYVDAAMGQLFDYLEKTDQWSSTIIIFTGDHGQSLGEHGESTHGYFAYNSTLWVPLIISRPGLKPKKVEENVCHIDIFPTICDLLGHPRPDYLQGQSLVPLIKGKKISQRKIYFESLYAYYRRGWAPVRGFIEGSKKFIDSPFPELYDLGNDFNESKNLATASVSREKEKLSELIKAESVAAAESRYYPDAQAREKLTSLGYVGGYQPPEKKTFGREDDLKTLLVFNNQFEQAQELYFHGKAKECEKLLKDLISKRPEFDNPYLFLVTIYEKEDRLDEAETLLKAGFEANPRNYKLGVEYGMVLASHGKNDLALQVLDKARELIDWDPELWNNFGVVYWNKGELEKAIEMYERALSLSPQYAVVLANLGAAETSLAMKRREASLLLKAEEHFKGAIEYDSGSVAAYNGLGAVYRLFGNLEAAIDCWQKAVSLDPSHPHALFNLGTAYFDLGDKEKALVYLSKYKQLYYKILPANEKAELDALIGKCR
jgi:arylsulfatase A-like enzyme/Tfp pilus assembly protein PilF